MLKSGVPGDIELYSGGGCTDDHHYATCAELQLEQLTACNFSSLINHLRLVGVGYSTSCKQLRHNSAVRTDGEFNLLIGRKLVQVKYLHAQLHHSFT